MRSFTYNRNRERGGSGIGGSLGRGGPLRCQPPGDTWALNIPREKPRGVWDNAGHRALIMVVVRSRQNPEGQDAGREWQKWRQRPPGVRIREEPTSQIKFFISIQKDSGCHFGKRQTRWKTKTMISDWGYDGWTKGSRGVGDREMELDPGEVIRAEIMRHDDVCGFEGEESGWRKNSYSSICIRDCLVQRNRDEGRGEYLDGKWNETMWKETLDEVPWPQGRNSKCWGYYKGLGPRKSSQLQLPVWRATGESSHFSRGGVWGLGQSHRVNSRGLFVLTGQLRFPSINKRTNSHSKNKQPQ